MAVQPSKQKGSWIVIVRREVDTEIICHNCTESEARGDPVAHSVGEREIEQVNWWLLKIEADE